MYLKVYQNFEIKNLFQRSIHTHAQRCRRFGVSLIDTVATPLTLTHEHTIILLIYCKHILIHHIYV